MWSHPGKQLLFMGAEMAQEREWSHDREIDWYLLDEPLHRGVRDLLRELNRVEAERPALWAADTTPAGFAWLDADDRETSVYSFLRLGPRAARWWRWSPTSRPCRGTATGSACRTAGAGSTCSTPTTSGGAAAGSPSPR